MYSKEQNYSLPCSADANSAVKPWLETLESVLNWMNMDFWVDSSMGGMLIPQYRPIRGELALGPSLT